MTVQLHVYDPTGGTLLGTLSEPHSIRWTVRMGTVGTLTFRVDQASTSDVALLEPRRVVRAVEGATVWAAFYIDEIAEGLADPSEVPTVTVTCVSLEGWLGTSDSGGAVVYPYGGLTGSQSDPRRFGPEAPEFDDDAWPEAFSNGFVTAPSWPDDRTERFLFQTNTLLRRRLPAGVEPSTSGRMFLWANAMIAVRVWLDGDLVLSKDAGQRGVFTVDIDYDGDEHIILIEGQGAAGEPGNIAWAWGETDEDEQLVRTMFQTFTEAVFGQPGAGGTIWRQLSNFDTYPGMTPGYILGTLVDEAQARGALDGLTVGFDAEDDSDSLPWPSPFSHSFPVGSKLGWVAEQLGALGYDWWVDAAGALQMVVLRGQDLTSTVSLAGVLRSDVKTTPPRATALLWLAADQMDDVEVEAAAARIEEAATFGTSGSALQAKPAAQALLGGLSEPDQVWNIDLAGGPDGWWLGDVVLYDGTPVRPVELTAVVDDDTGQTWWSVSAVAETAGFSRERARRVRDQLRAAFDQTAGGRSLLSSPRPSGRSILGGGGGLGTVVPEGGGNVPQLVLLAADEVVVDAGWQPVVWESDDTPGRLGYVLDGSGLTVSVGGVHVLRPTLTWESFDGGGSVRLLVGEEVRWGPEQDPQWTATAGGQFAGTAILRLAAGDVVTVEVNSGSESAQTASAVRMQVALPDPEGAGVQPVSQSYEEAVVLSGPAYWFVMDNEAGSARRLIPATGGVGGEAWVSLPAGSTGNETVYNVASPFDGKTAVRLNPDHVSGGRPADQPGTMSNYEFVPEAKTVSLWVRKPADATGRTIYSSRAKRTTNNVWRIEYTASGNIQLTNWGSADAPVVSDGAFFDGWVWVVAAADSAGASLWVNGVPQGTMDGTDSAGLGPSGNQSSVNTPFIGFHRTFVSGGITSWGGFGLLDVYEVVGYESKLTDAQVAALWAAMGPAPDSLVVD